MPSNSVGSVSERLMVWCSARSRSANCSVVAAKTSRPPRSNSASAARPRDEVERRALLRAGLGEDQRAVREVERGEPDLARDLGAAARSSAAGPAIIRWMTSVQVAVERQDDALADALDRLDRRDRAARRRRIDSAQHERARDPDALERLADGQRAQPLDVDGDVGQLGHAPRVARRAVSVRRGSLEPELVHQKERARRHRRRQRDREDPRPHDAAGQAPPDAAQPGHRADADDRAGDRVRGRDRDAAGTSRRTA